MTLALAVALVLGALAGALVRSRPTALPGLLCGGILLLVAAASPHVWNWARVRNGSGLPTNYIADVSLDSEAAQAFLFAAVGSFLGGVLVAVFVPPAPKVAPLGVDRVARLVRWASVVLLLMWCLGAGPSLWYRAVYLESDGIKAFTNIASLLGPLVGVAGLATARQAPTRRDRLMVYALAGAWFVLTSSLGSRVSLLFPVLGFGLFLQWAIHRRSWRWGIVAAGLTYPFVYVCLADFALTLLVRSTPHGLSMYLTNLSSPQVPQLGDPAAWVAPVQWLGSSISASTVITEFSVAYTPGADVLLVNANPLPSGLASAVDPFSAERFWPYEWIPLSFAGEWYGALGPLAQVLLFASITGYAGVATEVFRRRGLPIGTAMVLALVLLSMPISIQYPSRMFWRLISMVVLLPFGAPVLTALLRNVPTRSVYASVVR